MLPAFLKPVKDFIVTITLWTYYIMGYLVFFSPFYLSAFFFSARREEAFQKFNYRLHRLFFSLLRSLRLCANLKYYEIL